MSRDNAPRGDPEPGSGPDLRHGPGPELMGAGTLIGNDVYNDSAEDLGGIREFMIDMETGSICYAVLSFGGFMGMGEKLFAVPWSALRLDTKLHRFVLDVDRSRLVDAPGFDRHHWPDMADPVWAESIHAWYRRPGEGAQPR